MEKDFDLWNKQKKLLEERKTVFTFKERDIWWSSIGINIGNESCGKGTEFRRPILVLKKLSSTAYVGIPLSTKNKTGSWFIDITVDGENRSALLYQIRMFSTDRFQRRLTVLNIQDFIRIKEKLAILLELFIITRI